MIITQLHENVDEFYITDNAISSFPKLRSQGGQVDVYIEGVVVMPTKELVDGFIGILASYYVFNLAYPSSLAATLKLAPKVKKLLHKLDK